MDSSNNYVLASVQFKISNASQCIHQLYHLRLSGEPY